MEPPHAHITKVVGDKTDFGRNGRRRRKKSASRESIGHTILTKKMRNIDSLLHAQESFTEVREMHKRIRDIQSGRTYEQGSCFVNNKRPSSFKLSKKLNENRHPNQFLITEHVKNLASLSRRLSSVNNLQMRKKNQFDPVVYPTKVRRPGDIP